MIPVRDFTRGNKLIHVLLNKFSGSESIFRRSGIKFFQLSADNS